MMAQVSSFEPHAAGETGHSRSGAGVRLVVALFLGAVGGFFGLSVLFSDVMLSSPRVAYWLVVAAHHFVPGGGVGLLAPRRWYFAALASWGSVLMGLMALLAAARGAGLFAAVGYACLTLLIMPVLALLGGYLGARLAMLAGARWA